jgi:hypothetical protein
VCVRARVRLSEHLVSVPAITLSAGGGGVRRVCSALTLVDGCA